MTAGMTAFAALLIVDDDLCETDGVGEADGLLLGVVAYGETVLTLPFPADFEAAFCRRDGDGVAHQQRDDGKDCAVGDRRERKQRVDGMRFKRYQFGMVLCNALDSALCAARGAAAHQDEQKRYCQQSFHFFRSSMRRLSSAFSKVSCETLAESPTISHRASVNSA